MQLTLAEIADRLGLGQPAANPVITGAVIDSRKAKPGDLFICLPGARADGHDFASQAVANGAAAILAARPLPDLSVPVLVVERPELALGSLAAFWRGRFKGKVIAVTGTCGKTTCKQALAAILARAGRVTATEGNLNNQLGLPLTVLSGDADDSFWVLEAGISAPGDMEYLGAIARPDLAVILNAGAGHEQGLAAKGVAWHKAQLLRFLAPGGLGLVNCNYPALVQAAGETGARLEFFGAPGSHAYGKMTDKPGEYALCLHDRRLEVRTPLAGATGCENSLAAALAAREAGVSESQIQAGFGAMSLAPHRGESCALGNFELLDASYNANPLSMAAMLSHAAGVAARSGRPLICVLGEMRELGEHAQAEHEKIGALLARHAPALVFWKGGFLEETRAAFLAACGTEARFQAAPGPEEAAAIILKDPHFLEGGAVILFQGSRLNRLEEYVEAVQEALTAREKCDVL